MDSSEKKEVIKKKYGEIAMAGGSCCCSGTCCGDSSVVDVSKSVGYTDDQILSVPDANMGLGCGNPTLLRN